VLVQRVLSPETRLESWTVLGDDDVPVALIERYLGYLTDIERSPNTQGLRARLEGLVRLPRRPGAELARGEAGGQRAGHGVAAPAPSDARRRGGGGVAVGRAPLHRGDGERALSALRAFCQHAARHGVDLGEVLTIWQPAGRRGAGWKPFLHHISKGQPQPRRTLGLKAPRKLPRVLSVSEAQAILDACERLRDRFLFAVLHDTGMRIGEALGLRHADIDAAGREVSVVPRVNDNGARTKSRQPRSIPVSPELIRLYADYLHTEYGDLDSDYVFVNLWGPPHGYPLSLDPLRR